MEVCLPPHLPLMHATVLPKLVQYMHVGAASCTSRYAAQTQPVWPSLLRTFAVTTTCTGSCCAPACPALLYIFNTALEVCVARAGMLPEQARLQEACSLRTLHLPCTPAGWRQHGSYRPCKLVPLDRKTAQGPGIAIAPRRPAGKGRGARRPGPGAPTCLPPCWAPACWSLHV